MYSFESYQYNQAFNHIKNKVLSQTKHYARRVHVARSLLNGKNYTEIERNPSTPLIKYETCGTMIFLDRDLEKIYKSIKAEWNKIKNQIVKNEVCDIEKK